MVRAENALGLFQRIGTQPLSLAEIPLQKEGMMCGESCSAHTFVSATKIKGSVLCSAGYIPLGHSSNGIKARVQWHGRRKASAADLGRGG